MDTNSEQFDAIIVGGGVIGCALGFTLSRVGKRVLLLEKDQLGCGISNNTFAWVNATAKPSDRNYFLLNWQGLRLHHSLADQFSSDKTGFNPSGMIEWTSAGNTLMHPQIRLRYEALDQEGYDVSWLNKEQLQHYLPNLRFEQDACGFVSPQDGWVNMPMYIRFLSNQITESGGQILEQTEALSMLSDHEDQVIGINTTAGKFYGDKIICCAGQHTPEVLAALTGYAAYSARFPMQRAPGILLQTPPLPDSAQIDRVIYASHDHGIHMRPLGNGGLLLGDDNVDGLVATDPSSGEINQACETLLELAKYYLPGIPVSLQTQDCQHGIGVRAVPLDDHSIAGYLPGSDNVFVICTHSGVTLSLVLADLVTKSLFEGKLVEDLLPYGFSRFEKNHTI